MRTLPLSNIRSVIVLLAFFILAGGIGYRLGEKNVLSSPSTSPSPRTTSLSSTTQPSSLSSVDFSLFWDVWQKMSRFYIDADTLDSQKMVWGAITGMVAAAGDPYTSFLPPTENTEFKQDIGGEFEGIGAQLDVKDSRIVVVTPLKNSPAEKAGIKPGDYIVKVDGNETTGWTLQEAVTKIRGPKGSNVTLTIVHPGNGGPKDVQIERNTILVPSVESWIKPIAEITEITEATEAAQFKTRTDRVAYLKLSRFGDHTNEDWQQAVNTILSEQKKGTVKGLVFDLRNNPGGYLDGSVFIASEFIASGTVVSQKNSDGTIQKLSVNRKGNLLTMPMVVLVNKGSASAAEIVAGALKDYKRAMVVGETTFGKGSVQTPYELAQGASVHITTGKWLLPNGDSISQKGITPDFTITPSAEASKDGQLAKAIELLLK